MKLAKDLYKKFTSRELNKDIIDFSTLMTSSNDKPIDDTLNKLTSDKPIFFPKGVYWVRGFSQPNNEPYMFEGIQLEDNQILIFDDEAILKVIPNSSIGYAVINTNSAQNFELVNINIEGDRLEHTYKPQENNQPHSQDWFSMAHELGHGIYVSGNSKGKIYNPNIADCTGDSIDTRAYEGSDIEIYDGDVTRARRNSISIESIDRLRVYRTKISLTGGDIDEQVNIGGTPPKAGIDLEPFNSDMILGDVEFIDIETEGNYDGGLKTNYLYDAKKVRVKFTNCKIDGIKIISTDSPNRPGDYFIFENTTIDSGPYGIHIDGANPQVEFRGETTIIITDRKVGEVKQVKGAVEITKASTDSWYKNTTPGGITIDSLTVINDSSSPIKDVILTSYKDRKHIKELKEDIKFKDIDVNIKKSHSSQLVQTDSSNIIYSGVKVRKSLLKF